MGTVVAQTTTAFTFHKIKLHAQQKSLDFDALLRIFLSLNEVEQTNTETQLATPVVTAKLRFR